MIKLYPTRPGFTKEWTVEIDFSANGFATERHILPSWSEACSFIASWLGEEVKY